MRTETMERAVLHVEDKNDEHVIKRLLGRHGIDYHVSPLPDEIPNIGVAGSVEQLLKGMAGNIRVSNDRAVGFVLDADSPLADRWRAVASRLSEAEVDSVPEAISATGFIGFAPTYRARVGVWLMPDNQIDGAIEEFLQTLLGEAEPLFAHAQEATAKAKAAGARYPAKARSKAELYAWLAWQKDPGLPYGAALTARFFGHESPAAAKFVSWFRRLFGVGVAEL